MLNRRSIVDFLLVTFISAVIFLSCISQQNMGFWEPWETSTLLAAQHMAQSNITESSFWIPQIDSTFVAQPLLQLWSLTLMLHISPDPDPFLMRLPGAAAGIILVMMSFLAVRQAATRRAAWITAAVLLTMPMFVLSGKMIHGDIWFIFAISVPTLFYMLACYASTRRMHRTMLVFTGLSTFLSFLSGGIYALTTLAVIGVLYLILIWSHPSRHDVIAPLCTRYFLVSLFCAFVASAFIFGNYVTEARYALEDRTPMTLTEINEALDDDRIIAIERRGKQIIGTVKTGNSHDRKTQEQTPFILVESQGNLSTDATSIFEQNESERRTFVNAMMWRFQKKYPSRTEHEIPDISGAFKSAFRFFWHHTNNPIQDTTLTLVRARNASDVYAPSALSTGAENMASVQDDKVFSVAPDELVRVLNDDKTSKWVEIQNGGMQRGFIARNHIEYPDTNGKIHWTSWLDILLYGMMPWACFCPIIFLCIFAAPRKLIIANTPFIGEFKTAPFEETEKRSPLQSLLLCWLIAGIIALFVGLNQNHRDFFAGVVPAAILFGIALSSQPFWHDIRKSLEARLGLVLFAFATCAIAVSALYEEPFRLVRYLLTDPLMHWGAEQNIPVHYIVFCAAFFIFTLISFTGIAENIQTRTSAWLEQHKRTRHETRTSSSTTLMRVSRSESTPMPYAPAVSLILLALLSAGYIYAQYMPGITDNLTEVPLIDRYFELADQSEPVYILSGENSQLCLSYKDCDSGYVCRSNRCQISTFSSYSLNVAKQISKNDMLSAIAPNSNADPAFYIIPKDTLFDINTGYRLSQSEGSRRNLGIVDASSSRLYLIANHKQVQSVNPLDDIFIRELPKNVRAIDTELDADITLKGFKMDGLDLKNTQKLRMTVYYSVDNPILASKSFVFNFEIGSRKLEFKRPLLPNHYDETQLLTDDLIASPVEFTLPMMPSKGQLAVCVTTTDDPENLHPMTTIDY